MLAVDRRDAPNERIACVVRESQLFGSECLCETELSGWQRCTRTCMKGKMGCRCVCNSLCTRLVWGDSRASCIFELISMRKSSSTMKNAFLDPLKALTHIDTCSVLVHVTNSCIGNG